MIVDTVTKSLLFVTVLIEAYGSSWKSTGTGFIYDAQPPGADVETPALVTNKHVIADAERITLRFLSGVDGQPKWGEGVPVSITSPQQLFVGHPAPDIDVAVAPIGHVTNGLYRQGYELYMSSVSSSLAPTEAQVQDLDAILPVTFVGYPIGMYDTKNFTPIMRRGHTATPIHLDWKGEPIFLIDASVFPGSSGSPVFLVENGNYFSGGALNVGRSRVHFLGIVAAVHQQSSLASIVSQMPQVKFNQMIDLGIVYNWRAVDETVQQMCDHYGISRDGGGKVATVALPAGVPSETVSGRSGLEEDGSIERDQIAE